MIIQKTKTVNSVLEYTRLIM